MSTNRAVNLELECQWASINLEQLYIQQKKQLETYKAQSVHKPETEW